MRNEAQALQTAFRGEGAVLVIYTIFCSTLDLPYTRIKKKDKKKPFRMDETHFHVKGLSG